MTKPAPCHARVDGNPVASRALKPLKPTDFATTGFAIFPSLLNSAACDQLAHKLSLSLRVAAEIKAFIASTSKTENA